MVKQENKSEAIKNATKAVELIKDTDKENAKIEMQEFLEDLKKS